MKKTSGDIFLFPLLEVTKGYFKRVGGGDRRLVAATARGCIVIEVSVSCVVTCRVKYALHHTPQMKRWMKAFW